MCRFLIPPMLKQLELLNDTCTPGAIAEFLNEFQEMVTVYQNHAMFEEKYVFPAAQRYFPFICDGAIHEHEEEHHTMQNFISTLNDWKLSARDGASAKVLIALLKSDLPGWCEHLLQHLRLEERTITPVIRKYLPVNVQKIIVTNGYLATPASDWEVIFRYVLRGLALPAWKVHIICMCQVTFICVLVTTFPLYICLDSIRSKFHLGSSYGCSRNRSNSISLP